MRNSNANTAVRGSRLAREEGVEKVPLTSQFETTITAEMGSREAWRALRGLAPRCRTRTPLSTPPRPHGGGRSARKAPPFAWSESQAGAGGGSTRPREAKARPGDWSWRRRQSGKGAAVGQKDGAPQAARHGDWEEKRYQGE